jgi:O-methyltransferase
MRYITNTLTLRFGPLVSGLRYLYYIGTSIPKYARYRDRSMIRFLPFIENLAIAGSKTNIKSWSDSTAVVECGTWEGGMAGALIELCGRTRKYCFFDSFEGLPPAQAIDGQKALAWQADSSGSVYYDNCRASVETFYDTIGRSGIDATNVQVVKGFFEETLPEFDSPEIIVLRLDGDWYESTMTCLRKFWDHVVVGGVILIDDYYSWDGCSRAVHDFLSERKASERVHQGHLAGIAYIVKESE